MTEEWRSDIYGLLPQPSTSRVLMLESEAGWSLPRTEVTGKIDLTPGLATREMRRELGLPVTAYRYARIKKDEQSGHQEGIFAFDGLDHITTLSNPTPTLWITKEDITDLRLNQPDHRDVIEEYLRELETGITPQLRQPWEHRGWFAVAACWIAETLGSLDYEMIAPPEQVRWWSLSCVLRIATARGDVYFKASARQPFFANEPSLLRYLAHLYPEHVPTILAADPLNGWMLLGDVGPTLGKQLPIERKIEILQVFGALQRDTAEHVDQLLDLGCADRKPQNLISRIDPLLNDELAISKLTTDEVGELQREAPRIVDMCLRCSNYSIPPTLIHGDFHLENVAVSDGKMIVLDWTEACIAHPFMDMFFIFNEREEPLHSQLRDAYLALWTDFETMERLRELWSLCGVIHAIHHAVSYQSILCHTEERSRSELGDAPPFLLRKALRYLNELK